jgi:hypothetical protein
MMGLLWRPPAQKSGGRRRASRLKKRRAEKSACPVADSNSKRGSRFQLLPCGGQKKALQENRGPKKVESRMPQGGVQPALQTIKF